MTVEAAIVRASLLRASALSLTGRAEARLDRQHGGARCDIDGKPWHKDRKSREDANKDDPYCSKPYSGRLEERASYRQFRGQLRFEFGVGKVRPAERLAN